MRLPIIEVSFAEDVPERLPEIEAIAATAVRAAMERTSFAIDANSELSLHFCGDETIEALNKRWRGKNSPTNVLSFPNQPDGPLLGDIIVSLDTVKREATLENKSVNDHLTHLVVHGFLHLFGYDHDHENEAHKMESLETEILKELGIADPYLDTEVADRPSS
ncbi:MAG: rRNA maturation RNase YbeY [Pseudomonadota bacterium]